VGPDAQHAGQVINATRGPAVEGLDGHYDLRHALQTWCAIPVHGVADLIVGATQQHQREAREVLAYGGMLPIGQLQLLGTPWNGLRRQAYRQRKSQADDGHLAAGVQHC
jgi:hypothetical protein